MNENRNLIGKTIAAAQPVHDYVQLVFNDQGILSIYNNFDVIPQEPTGLSHLAGSSVESISEDEQAIRIDLSGGKSIRVRISHDDQFGPEAMFYAKGDLMIAWPNK